MYVVRPDRADAPDLVGALLAETSPRTRVVLLSERDADYTGPDGWALRAERAVRDSGRAWTILRPNWFMQVFTDPRFYRDQVSSGELPFSSGGASVAWIDARDIAAVAERALLDQGHAGQVYELSGPEALSLPRTAEPLSRAVGHPVTFREVTIDEGAAAGAAGFERDLFALTFERVHAGSFAVVTDTVERVTGTAGPDTAGLPRRYRADTGPRELTGHYARDDVVTGRSSSALGRSASSTGSAVRRMEAVIRAMESASRRRSSAGSAPAMSGMRSATSA